MPDLLATLRDGFDRRSAFAIALVGLTYSAVGYNYRFLIRPDLGMDWLLAGIWTVMTVALVWSVRPRADLVLIAVALGGGTVIEWWGTNTELWRYFTRERPPLWILPAWPIAAIAIERIARVVAEALPSTLTLGRAYYPLMALFVVYFTTFMWPAMDEPSTWVVLAIMLAVTFVSPRTDRDVQLFLVGAFAGIFLEYWGTSRRCWVYYDAQVPPPQAVLAHGFATVAFARGVQLVESVLGDFSGAQPDTAEAHPQRSQ